MAEEELIKGIEEFESSAIDMKGKKKYRSSVVLFYKAIAETCDLILYLKLRKIPDNWEERFRLLEKYIPAAYIILHISFPIYRKTYRSNISKEECERIENAYERIKKIKESIEKSI